MNSKQRNSKLPQIIARDGSYCCWCKRFLLHNELTIEHIIPKSMGGTNALENLRCACSQCNRKRGNKFFPFKEILSPEKVNYLLDILHQMER